VPAPLPSALLRIPASGAFSCAVRPNNRNSGIQQMPTPDGATITFTEDKIEHFRYALADAIIARKEQFLFEDQPFLVSYATYLLRYLEGVQKLTSYNVSERALA